MYFWKNEKLKIPMEMLQSFKMDDSISYLMSTEGSFAMLWMILFVLFQNNKMDFYGDVYTQKSYRFQEVHIP